MVVGQWTFIVACIQELILRWEYRSKCSLQISLIEGMWSLLCGLWFPFVTLFFNLCSSLFQSSLYRPLLKCLPIPCIKQLFLCHWSLWNKVYSVLTNETWRCGLNLLSCFLVLYSLLCALFYWVCKYHFSLIFTWCHSYLNTNHIWRYFLIGFWHCSNVFQMTVFCTSTLNSHNWTFRLSFTNLGILCFHGI